LVAFTGDRCYDLKNIFAEKNSKNIGVLTQNSDKLGKNGIQHWSKKRQFFHRKSLKILIITLAPDWTKK
jgi:hypothetical protein